MNQDLTCTFALNHKIVWQTTGNASGILSEAWSENPTDDGSAQWSVKCQCMFLFYLMFQALTVFSVKTDSVYIVRLGNARTRKHAAKLYQSCPGLAFTNNKFASS